MTKKLPNDLSEYPPQYHAALTMLTPLWRGIPGDYKQKYARNIWDQFADNIRAAAYTSSLSRFINSICSRLRIEVAGGDVSDVLSALSAEDERAILRQLRDETTTLVLMVRLENEKRRDEWKAWEQRISEQMRMEEAQREAALAAEIETTDKLEETGELFA